MRKTSHAVNNDLLHQCHNVLLEQIELITFLYISALPVQRSKRQKADRRQLKGNEDKYKIDDLNNIYDEVDESEYGKDNITASIRQGTPKTIEVQH